MTPSPRFQIDSCSLSRCRFPSGLPFPALLSRKRELPEAGLRPPDVNGAANAARPPPPGAFLPKSRSPSTFQRESRPCHHRGDLDPATWGPPSARHPPGPGAPPPSKPRDAPASLRAPGWHREAGEHREERGLEHRSAGGGQAPHRDAGRG